MQLAGPSATRRHCSAPTTLPCFSLTCNKPAFPAQAVADGDYADKFGHYK